MAGIVDDDAAAAAAAPAADPPEALAIWQQFIVGMLANLGPLPIDRIHFNLRQFASFGPFPYEKAMHELRPLLLALHAQGVVRAREDNLYAVPE